MPVVIGVRHLPYSQTFRSTFLRDRTKFYITNTTVFTFNSFCGILLIQVNLIDQKSKVVDQEKSLPTSKKIIMLADQSVSKRVQGKCSASFQRPRYMKYLKLFISAFLGISLMSAAPCAGNESLACMVSADDVAVLQQSILVGDDVQLFPANVLACQRLLYGFDIGQLATDMITHNRIVSFRFLISRLDFGVADGMDYAQGWRNSRMTMLLREAFRQQKREFCDVVLGQDFALDMRIYRPWFTGTPLLPVEDLKFLASRHQGRLQDITGGFFAMRDCMNIEVALSMLELSCHCATNIPHFIHYRGRQPADLLGAVMGNDYLGEESITRLVRRYAELGLEVNEMTYELFTRYRPYPQTVQAIRIIIDGQEDVKDPGCD